jgi:transposase
VHFYSGATRLSGRFSEGFCLRRLQAAAKLLGDKAYDSAPLRQWLKDRGTKAVVPNKSNRKQPFSFGQEILQTTAPHRECL